MCMCVKVVVNNGGADRADLATHCLYLNGVLLPQETHRSDANSHAQHAEKQAAPSRIDRQMNVNKCIQNAAINLRFYVKLQHFPP